MQPLLVNQLFSLPSGKAAAVPSSFQRNLSPEFLKAAVQDGCEYVYKYHMHNKKSSIIYSLFITIVLNFTDILYKRLLIIIALKR